jgi:hypothetical protein
LHYLQSFVGVCVSDTNFIIFTVISAGSTGAYLGTHSDTTIWQAIFAGMAVAGGLASFREAINAANRPNRPLGTAEKSKPARPTM